MEQYKSYVICATARTGSTLLCKLLSATGVAGKPESYFHQPSTNAWQKSLDMPFDDRAGKTDILRKILTSVQEKGQGGTDIFGLRLMRKSFDFLMTQLDTLYPGLPSDYDRFNAAFGQTLFIHLTREDKLAQAISLVTAHQTGLWHKAPDGTELERSAAPQTPIYDADQITQHLAELTAFDATWDRWFRQEKLTPVRVTYEALSTDPIGITGLILSELGLDQAAAKGVAPGVTKLADQTNQNWAARFRAEGANT